MRACGEEQCPAQASCAGKRGAIRMWDEGLVEGLVSAHAERGGEGWGVGDGLGDLETVGRGVLD